MTRVQRVSMGLSVWRETSKKLTVYRVCYTPIETLCTVHLYRVFILKCQEILHGLIAL